MTHEFDDFQKLAKDQLETAAATSTSFSKGIQDIASETAEYSKTSLEAGSTFLQKLVGAKSLEDAVQIQLEYTKSATAAFAAQATRIAEIYADLAKDLFKPLESAISAVQVAKIK